MASDYSEHPTSITPTFAAKSHRFADVTVAVVYTDNAQKAEQFNAAWGGASLSGRINSVLSGRFAAIVQAANAASAVRAGANLLAVVDARATYSMGLLDTGTAQINVDFKTLDDALIERVSASGLDERFAGPVAPAVDQAVVAFANNLDGAGRLWAEADKIAAARGGGKTVAATPAAATPAAMPLAWQSRFPTKSVAFGLFTKHFLLGQSGEADKAPHGNGDGRVTLEELDRYLKDTLTYYARRYYGRDQTAQIVKGF